MVPESLKNIWNSQRIITIDHIMIEFCSTSVSRRYSRHLTNILYSNYRISKWRLQYGVRKSKKLLKFTRNPQYSMIVPQYYGIHILFSVFLTLTGAIFESTTLVLGNMDLVLESLVISPSEETPVIVSSLALVSCEFQSLLTSIDPSFGIT